MGAKYCNECGARVHLRECAQCDAINEPGVANCYKCGAPMTPRALEERDTAAGNSGAAIRVPPPGLPRRPAGHTPTPARPQSTIVAAYSKPASSADSAAATRVPTPEIAHDDANALETPVHFISDAPMALDVTDADADSAHAPDSSRPVGYTHEYTRWHAGDSAAVTVRVLLLLCMAGAFAGLVHYRPDVFDDAFALVRSTFARLSGVTPEIVPTIPAPADVAPSPPAR